MSVLSGFEDLKSKQVMTVSGGQVLVNGINTNMELWAKPDGTLHIKHPEPAPIDQTGERPKRTMEEKWAASGIDQ